MGEYELDITPEEIAQMRQAIDRQYETDEPGWHTIDEWAAALGVARSTIKKQFRDAVAEGTIIKRDGGEPGAWRRNKDGHWNPATIYKAASHPSESAPVPSDSTPAESES